MNIATGNNGIENHGQVALMKLPGGWVETQVAKTDFDISCHRKFTPMSDRTVELSLYYRGHGVDAASAAWFRELLLQPAHLLSQQELIDATIIIRNAADRKFFVVVSARTESLNDKTVLVVEGRWRASNHDTHWIFVDADGTGRFVQEIFYSAPQSEFSKFWRAALQSLSSIVWK